MTGTISAAIGDEEVIEQNAMAWVTQNFIIFRNRERPAFTIVSRWHIVGLRIEKKPFMALLVISVALFVLAAAAFASREGGGAGWPCAALGVFLLYTYFSSRRATVTFLLDEGGTEKVTGTVHAANSLRDLIDQQLQAEAARF